MQTSLSLAHEARLIHAPTPNYKLNIDMQLD